MVKRRKPRRSRRARELELPEGWGRDGRLTRSEWVLIRRAVKGEWPIPDKMKKVISAQVNAELARLREPLSSGDGALFLSMAPAIVTMREANERRLFEKLEAFLSGGHDNQPARNGALEGIESPNRRDRRR